MATHGHHRSKHHRVGNGASPLWKPHKDWRVWVAVLLMLAAIAAYVVSLDDSLLLR